MRAVEDDRDLPPERVAHARRHHPVGLLGQVEDPHRQAVEPGVEVDLEVVGGDRPPVVAPVLDLVLAEVLGMRRGRSSQAQEQQHELQAELRRPHPDFLSPILERGRGRGSRPPLICSLHPYRPAGFQAGAGSVPDLDGRLDRTPLGSHPIGAIARTRPPISTSARRSCWSATSPTATRPRSTAGGGASPAWPAARSSRIRATSGSRAASRRGACTRSPIRRSARRCSASASPRFATAPPGSSTGPCARATRRPIFSGMCTPTAARRPADCSGPSSTTI